MKHDPICSLEEVFASLMLGGETLSAEPTAVPESPAATPEVESSGLMSLEVQGAPTEASAATPATEEPELGTPGSKKVFYSLNPFDGGGSRDLSRPVKTEGASAPPAEDQDPECEEQT